MTRHQIIRVRHNIRRRTITVDTITDLSPRMRRILFRSDTLRDFVSASPDDHIKLFFAVDGAKGGQSVMRDYTPRSFDTQAGTLTLDFALHEAGPATQWAAAAQPGDTLAIGGPRGSAIVPDDFDWYLLMGDETALPAIGRRVEELRPGVPVITAVVVDGPEGRQDFATVADWRGIWAYREGSGNDATVLGRALAGLELPQGDGFIWIAGETQLARALRRYALETLAHPREWIKAAGYWTRGLADTHARIED